jgi:hypothetical protein
MAWLFLQHELSRVLLQTVLCGVDDEGHVGPNNHSAVHHRVEANRRVKVDVGRDLGRRINDLERTIEGGYLKAHFSRTLGVHKQQHEWSIAEVEEGIVLQWVLRYS